MDLFTLTKPEYVPNQLVEGYASLIWTERFKSPSEFEIRGSDVQSLRSQLPLKTFVSHRKSTDVMIVETHEIEHTDDGPEIVIRGRSLSHYIEHRYQRGYFYNKAHRISGLKTPKETMALLLWNNFANPDGHDVSLHIGYTDKWDVVTDIKRAAVDNVGVIMSNGGLGDAQKRYVAQGPLKPIIEKLQDEGELGLKMRRPTWTGNEVRVRNSTDFGAVEQHWVTNSPKMYFYIYAGRDRSIDQSLYDPVVFRIDAGHIDQDNYLMSIKNFKTAIVMPWEGASSTSVTLSPYETTYSEGWDFRAAYDASDAIEKDDPQDTTPDGAWLGANAQALLREKHLEKDDVDGVVSPDHPYTWGTDYDLGDLVTFIGRYGTTTTMQVNEYIYVDDVEGVRHFPSFKKYLPPST